MRGKLQHISAHSQITSSFLFQDPGTYLKVSTTMVSSAWNTATIKKFYYFFSLLNVHVINQIVSYLQC